MSDTISKFNIRAAVPEDAANLALIGAATFVDAYCDVLPGANIIAHCAKEHSAARYQDFLQRAKVGAWLAETSRKGAAIGYALNLPPDLPVAIEKGDIELKRIYLLSRFQGCGAGKALLAASVNHAREQGAGRLLVGVYDQNDKAIAFYRRQGFVPIGTREFQVGGDFYHDLVLALPI
jgi:diamine N-acetyltransferase